VSLNTHSSCTPSSMRHDDHNDNRSCICGSSDWIIGRFCPSIVKREMGLRCENDTRSQTKSSFERHVQAHKNRCHRMSGTNTSFLFDHEADHMGLRPVLCFLFTPNSFSCVLDADRMFQVHVRFDVWIWGLIFARGTCLLALSHDAIS
jgi:hypothetical protein